MSVASGQPLANASVIITRPVGHGRALARRVRALGGQPVWLPAVSLRPEAPTAALLASLQQALAGDVVLFTSPAAVYFAAQLAPLRGRAQIGTVGRATAQALARHGVVNVLVPERTQDSEGLLAHPVLARMRGKTLAVIGAPGGRGVLQQRLGERGAQVTDVAVYRRVPARLDARHRQALHSLRPAVYVLLSSVQVVRQLQITLGDDWRQVSAGMAVVSSARVGAAARAAGFVRITEADSALVDDLVACALGLAAG